MAPASGAGRTEGTMPSTRKTRPAGAVLPSPSAMACIWPQHQASRYLEAAQDVVAPIMLGVVDLHGVAIVSARLSTWYPGTEIHTAPTIDEVDR